MTTEDKHSPEMATAMAQWMDQAARTWKDLLHTWPVPEAPAADEKTPGTDSSKTDDADPLQSDAAFKNWQSFFQSIAQPDPASMMSGMPGMSGAQSVPPVFSQLATSSWQLFTSMQQAWAKQIGQFVDQDRIKEWLRPDEEALSQWSDFYEKEIRKYLTIPQIGLNKFSQENFNRMIDRFNAKQLALMEFFDLLYRPVRQGATWMQGKTSEWIDAGQFPHDPKTIYRQWLKFVEGRYMALFRSEEFLRLLQKALTNTFEYHNARKAVIEEVSSQFSIPTGRDLDEVYRELHNLKQQVRTMESQLYEYTAQASSTAHTA